MLDVLIKLKSFFVKKQAFFLIGIGLVISSCGAMNFSKKMDETNGQMQIMIQKMDEANKKMDKTNDAVRNQEMLVPLENLLREKNWDYLLPIPYNLLAYAHKFAESIHSRELLEFNHLWLEIINRGKPTPEISDEGNGNPFAREDKPLSKEAIKKINNEKMVRLIILQAIAGLAPQSTVEEMVQQELFGTISGSGQQIETLYAFLMMRYQFIRDVLLDGSLIGNKMSHIGNFESAVTLLKQMEYIAHLAFVDRIELRISGFLSLTNGAPLDSDKQAYEKLNPKDVEKRWILLKDRFEECTEIKSPGPKDLKMEKAVENYQIRVENQRKIIEDKVKSFKAQNAIPG